ncbi:hypothetical protein C0J52_26582, partial [Blattella germanica]
TWSDREIRTLLTRCFELPLNYARVVKFESDITNCSKDLPEEINISTPPYERYQDSKLPVVSKKLVSNCKPIADLLKKKFGSRKLYRYQIEREKHQDISFKMLNSNISQLVSHLDDIRRIEKGHNELFPFCRKFICLNDNLDPERAEDNAVARAILQDMYESLFPKPSSFELPPEFRNRFLHVSELQAWRKGRNTVRTVVYICLAILIAFTLVNFFHVEKSLSIGSLCCSILHFFGTSTKPYPPFLTMELEVFNKNFHKMKYRNVAQEGARRHLRRKARPKMIVRAYCILFKEALDNVVSYPFKSCLMHLTAVLTCAITEKAFIGARSVENFAYLVFVMWKRQDDRISLLYVSG